MKAIQSALRTRSWSRPYGSSHWRWAGPSLSKAKPLPSWQIHQEQLLMLLVVVQAQGEQIGPPRVRRAASEPCLHAPVDLAPVGQHLVQRRPRHQAALAAFHPIAQGFVIAVEQALEAGIDRLIVRRVGQNHRFEEPAGVGQVPFAGAAVRHRLGGHVLGRQPPGQGRHGGPDAAIVVEPRVGRGSRFQGWFHAAPHVSRPKVAVRVNRFRSRFVPCGPPPVQRNGPG